MQLEFNVGLRNQDNKITSHCNFKAVTEAQILSQNLFLQLTTIYLLLIFQQ